MVFTFTDLRKRVVVSFPPAVSEKYFVSNWMAKGGFGDVWSVYRVNDAIQLAMKTFSDRIADEAMNEIHLMRKVEHPCIIKLIESIVTEDRAFMIMEFCPGGDLMARIQLKKFLGECTAKIYFYQICNAISYLHSQHITHRDVKPENVLLLNNDDETKIKICDFGISKDTTQSELQSFCGTLDFMSPEMLATVRTVYSNKVDIWSLGVVLYTMLSGNLPFCNANHLVTKTNIRSGNLQFHSRRWENVSDVAQKLIKDLLKVNPNERPSANQIMLKPWLQDEAFIAKVHAIMHSVN
jgi:serine/threonine-protein kinase Chk2